MQNFQIHYKLTFFCGTGTWTQDYMRDNVSQTQSFHCSLRESIGTITLLHHPVNFSGVTNGPPMWCQGSTSGVSHNSNVVLYKHQMLHTFLNLWQWFFLWLWLESHHCSGRGETQKEATGRRTEKEGRTRGRTSLSTGERGNAETVWRRHAEAKTEGSRYITVKSKNGCFKVGGGDTRLECLLVTSNYQVFMHLKEVVIVTQKL